MAEINEKEKAFQAMMEGYRASYINELPAKIDHIEQLILRHEDANLPTEISEQLYRDVHSLKGTAGTYGLQIITTICHHLEDQLGHFNKNYVETCLHFIDLMRTATEVIASTSNPSFKEVEIQLYKLQKQLAKNKKLGMIVDSSRLNAAMLTCLLEPYPIKITIMDDGLKALSRLLFEKYDFLITSREVPSLNGIALISALRTSDSTNKNIKSIILTSKTNLRYYAGCQPDMTVVKDTHLSHSLANAIESCFPDFSTYTYR